MSPLSGDPDLRTYLERARHERALALAALLKALGRAVVRASHAGGRVALRAGRALGAHRARRRRARAALRELSALDERALKDIGLNRGDIPFLAWSYARAGRPAARTPAGILTGGAALEGGAPGPAPEAKSAAPADPAHELRTPLTSIRSFSEILRDNPDLSPAERAEFLRIVIAESERLDHAIDDLLGRRAA